MTDDAPTLDVVPKIGFHKATKRHVVHSVNLGRCIAHRHFNVTGTARLVEQTRPDLSAEFIWDRYYAKTGRWLPCVYIGRAGLLAMFERFHNVPDCRDIYAVLRRYLTLFDQAEAPAQPAPDEQIRPPIAEPANLFDPPEPEGEPAESWEINAAVHLLAKHTTLPRYLRDDMEGWNLSRCKSLAEKTRDFDRISAIYARTKPE
jgi:hypothetical protein